MLQTVGDASHKLVNNMKIRISLSIFLNRAVYEIMWKNMVQSDRPQMAL
jgi:hypothetical protein